jgi:hypothetical protein
VEENKMAKNWLDWTSAIAAIVGGLVLIGQSTFVAPLVTYTIAGISLGMVLGAVLLITSVMGLMK